MSKSRQSAPTEDSRRAAEWLEATPTPEPRPEFRARLAREFSTGTFAESGRTASWAVPRRGTRWLPALAAAAALLVALWGIPRLNRGPQWRVASVEGGGIVVVDQLPVPAGHLDQLARLIKPGTRVRTHAAAVELVSPGQLAIEVTPGTDLVVPRPPGRWFDRVARGYMAVGEVRVTTGPGFRGARLELSTPEARVQVTGTTLAVIREPQGTCVCVLEGRVMVGADPGDMRLVGPGSLHFIFGDGRPAADDQIRPVERVKLAMFRDGKRAELENPQPPER